MSFTRTLRAVGGAVVAGALLFGTAPVASADDIRDRQWALDTLSIDKVWSESTGQGVTVAVIDNGVNGQHPDLQGSVLAGKNFTTGDPADQETKNDHGTSMASIIAGHGHGPGQSQGIKGLAPGAKILPIKYTDTDGSYLAQGTFAAPLRYAVDRGAQVVNMSFGNYQLSDDEEQAISYALQKDVLLVAGSGNSGSENLEYPAAAPGVLAVGAVGKDQKVWEDSNYGSHVLLTAPGMEIASAAATKPYRYANGTSDAAAYVSGAAALLRAKFPDLTAGQIANRLTKTADIPDGANVESAPDPYYGYGVIDPYEALTADIPAGPENGPLKAPEEVVDGASPGAVPPNAAGADDSSGGDESSKIMAVVFGILAWAVIIAIIVTVIVLLVKRKKRRNSPPPGGPGGWGPSGGVPGQQGYQQPGAPGSYPSYPPPPQHPGGR